MTNIGLSKDLNRLRMRKDECRSRTNYNLKNAYERSAAPAVYYFDLIVKQSYVNRSRGPTLLFRIGLSSSRSFDYRMYTITSWISQDIQIIT